jgi:ABC-2 type transport system ATP-binding protein
VDDITFYVERGAFFSLLGPNGAGKTTTISILTTLLSKTAEQ